MRVRPERAIDELNAFSLWRKARRRGGCARQGGLHPRRAWVGAGAQAEEEEAGQEPRPGRWRRKEGVSPVQPRSPALIVPDPDVPVFMLPLSLIVPLALPDMP